MAEADCPGVPSTDAGPGGVPKGKCYTAGNPVFSNVMDIRERAPSTPGNDEWFQGYSTKPVNPGYRTTNSSYGSKAPSVHTMPTKFHAKSQGFTEKLGKVGMFRNYSLNTAMDRSNVSDH